MSNTKELPIVLTVDEVKAVIAGDKTQYRAIICPDEDTGAFVVVDYGKGWQAYKSSDGESALLDDGCEHRLLCPFGVIGDRLWVQEFHARTDRNMHLTAPHYYADGPLTLDDRHDAGLLTKYSAADMPRWASRLTLEINDIRIELVKDINEVSAKDEGFKPTHPGCSHQFSEAIGMHTLPHRASFIDAWDRKHGAGSFMSNPWVWAIEFTIIKENNDG